MLKVLECQSIWFLRALTTHVQQGQLSMATFSWVDDLNSYFLVFPVVKKLGARCLQCVQKMERHSCWIKAAKVLNRTGPELSVNFFFFKHIKVHLVEEKQSNLREITIVSIAWKCNYTFAKEDPNAALGTDLRSDLILLACNGCINFKTCLLKKSKEHKR